MQTFDPEPVVILQNYFQNAKGITLGAARTCYSSKGPVLPDEAGSSDRAAVLQQSIYDGGHHTTFQHPHFLFIIGNVSRHFLWSFLHSHPFYNSEQVSQRYVAVLKENYLTPPLPDKHRTMFDDIVAKQMTAYHELIEQTIPVVAEEFYRLFPARLKDRNNAKKWTGVIKKKAQELARYVLPVATIAFLYHTVSGLTLLRYHRMCDQLDVPLETRRVVGKMIEEAKAAEPGYFAVLEDPIPLEKTLEYQAFSSLFGKQVNPDARQFIKEYDQRLEGLQSKLVDWKANAEQSMAQSIRDVLGASTAQLSDDDAIDLVLNPAKNRFLGEKMNVSTHSKLERALFHPHYTFQKKLSHTADSQDQRHRMTPASRPILAGHLTTEPDCVWPSLWLDRHDIMEKVQGLAAQTWDVIGKLLNDGVPVEFAQYLLPNAVAIRFTESGDLLNLQHKWHMRLCLNAQEEIWRASLQEVQQIAKVHPKLVKYAAAPCLMRSLAKVNPPCPEGERYCGVPLWRIDVKDYRRTI